MRIYPRAVVTFAGARDNYQLPIALHEEGLLESLVTDMYWPADKRLFSSTLGLLLPEGVVSARFRSMLESNKVHVGKRALLAFVLGKAVPSIWLTRYKDQALGRTARHLAFKHNSAVWSTNYYAFDAFQEGIDRPRYRLFFQLQADPIVLRSILLEELERTPLAASSLRSEYELSLSQEQLHKLSYEPHLANGWVSPCSFAAATLTASDIPPHKPIVVPFGVDSSIYIQREQAPFGEQPFKVAYVGSLRQRKGLSYLLEGIRRLGTKRVHLTLYTRELESAELLRSYSDIEFDVVMGLSGVNLARALHQADVFVFPSLAEGFAHVILEAMACGLPVITTPHTCGPDVIDEGIHGFIIPIRDADAISERLAWGMENRAELAMMGATAAQRAREFTWERFRRGIRQAYKQMIDDIR